MSKRLFLDMKCLRLAIACVLVSTLNLAAQHSTDQANSTGKYIYRFPSFSEGTIVFRNGLINPANLNYNIALDEMHFISQAGDTLSIADPVTIHFVSLQGQRFYYDKGFLQTVTADGDIILAYKQVIKDNEKREGAFGIETDKPGVRNYDFVFINGRKLDLNDDDSNIITTESYFFGDAYGHFFKANKDYILLHYKDYRQELDSFLKTNHISFNRQDDLLKLLKYANGIVQK